MKTNTYTSKGQHATVKNGNNRGKRDRFEWQGCAESLSREDHRFSRAQVTRLIGQDLTDGNIGHRRGIPAQPFARRYTSADVDLLIEIDTLHDTLSGPAIRKLCERARDVFGDQRFAQLAKISNGHLYNLRHCSGYQR